MATLSAVRSFQTVLLMALLAGFLTTGCKKSAGSEVDPRDQYVGTYTGTYRITIYFSADIFSITPGTASINVTKASSANEVYIETTYDGNYKEKVTADITDANFTVIDKTTDQIVFSSTNKVDTDYKATGSFNVATKAMAYSATARGLRNGAEYTKTYEITGTMK